MFGGMCMNNRILFSSTFDVVCIFILSTGWGIVVTREKVPLLGEVWNAYDCYKDI